MALQGGAQVSASTFGAGNSGSLTVTADSIQLTGTSSGLFAQANRGSTGNAGNLTINTHQLALQGGVQLSAGTLGAGKGGDLTINDTGQLAVQDGAGVSASTSSAGNGGNLTVTADSIQLTGISTNGQTSSGLFAQASSGSTGNAGNLTINTRELFVRFGARVFVQSLGTGTAGNLKVNARSIRLNNGTLSANTPSNSTNPNLEQATITLNSKDLILINGSQITTNATGNNVIGGNIDIDTDVLATIQRSNISANSVDFRGGQVIINTQGLFRSPDSTITATGVNSQSNGTVQISNPEVDPSRGLVALPTVTENTPKLVSSSCAAFADVGGSNFTVTGRSGLPPSPSEPLTSDVVWTDTRLPVTTVQQYQRKTHAAKPKSQSQPIAIVPATGWVFNGKGEIILTAYDPTKTGSQRSWREPASCAPR